MFNLTFVTVCKSRLSHIQQSLPQLARQAHSQTVLVDADCPEKVSVWAAEHCPNVQTITLPTATPFNLAASRNAGLAKVTTPWVCFIDADVIVMPDFAETVVPQLSANQFYNFDTRKGPSISGSVIVETAMARKVDGYDDAIIGWGGEDIDFYNRLEAVGCTRVELSSDALQTVIQHESALRTQNYEFKSMKTSSAITALYRTLKLQLGRLKPDIALTKPMRDEMFANARKAVLAAQSSASKTIEFQIGIPPDPSISFPGSKLEQRLWFKLTL